MRAERYLIELWQGVVKDMGFAWPAKAVVEPPRELKHGDLAGNLALLLTKEAAIPPRTLAETMAKALQALAPDTIERVEVAGPGFVNVTFTAAFWHVCVQHVEEQGDRFGSHAFGAKRRIQIEYVSANPTGPLHIGHGRGAAVGDALARILDFAGYAVQCEYYINDAGRQMRLLGLSIWLRVLELDKQTVEWPKEYYKGSYIIDIARDILAKQADLPTWDAAKGEALCFDKGVRFILDGIKQDLRDFRVRHDVWYSEQTLVDNGAIERCFERLLKAGLAYEEGGALWFATTRFGDDKDRVLRKSDGTLTYFASDIAYHDEKYQRGFDILIDVWGADHHGYIPRMRAAIEAFGRNPKTDFGVVLIQFVNLLEGGEQIAMSTRAGQFETLADVIRDVGVDAARFMFLSRKSDSPLDFDIELVKQRTMDNPVYYVQYAHARVQSVLRKAQDLGIVLPVATSSETLACLQNADERALLRCIDRFEDITRTAANQWAPHFVSYYLLDLANLLHSYYGNNPWLQAGDPTLVLARLALVRALGQVLANGLGLLGVTAPESM